MNAKARARNTLIGITLIAIVSSFLVSAIGNALNYVVEYYESDYVAVSMYFMFLNLGMVAGYVLMNTLIKKTGLKKTLFVGVLLAIVSYLVIVYVKSTAVLNVMGVLHGMSYALTSNSIMSLIAMKWYKGDVSTLIGFSVLAISGVNILFPTLFTALLENFGFRNGMLALTIGVAVLMMAGVAMISDEPEKYGLEPVLYTSSKKKAEKENVSAGIAAQDLAMPMSRLMRNPLIWLVFLCPVLISFVSSYTSTCATYIYKSYGLDNMQIGYLLSIGNAATTLCMPIFGYLVDKTRNPKLMYTIFTLLSAFALVTPLFMGGFFGAMVYAILIRTNGTRLYFVSMVAPALIGNEKSEKLISWVQAACLGFSIPAATIFTSVSEAGGMTTVFLLMAGMTFVSVVGCVALLSKGARNAIQKADAAYQAEAK